VRALLTFIANDHKNKEVCMRDDVCGVIARAPCRVLITHTAPGCAQVWRDSQLGRSAQQRSRQRAQECASSSCDRDGVCDDMCCV
jgi:hypothetical protein